jgi:pimeloyl-ACP methyl ester carboxylesterase
VTRFGSRSVYRSSQSEAAIRRWCENRLESWACDHGRRVLSTELGSTHAVMAGPESSASLVVWLPGTNHCAATSRAVVEALAGESLVAAIDLPGQPGLSEGGRPPRPRLATYGAWATDVVAALSQGRRTVLVGHSLGAAVALASAAAVSGLVLVDPAGLSSLRVDARTLAATMPWLLRPTPSRSAALVRVMMAPGAQGDPAQAEWMTLVARHCRSTLAPPPLSAAVVDRWRGRVAVLSGEFDTFLPPARLRTAVHERLGVELTVVPRSGHLLPEESPGSVVNAVRAMLTESL